jgi:hypothetical protein
LKHFVAVCGGCSAIETHWFLQLYVGCVAGPAVEANNFYLKHFAAVLCSRPAVEANSSSLKHFTAVLRGRPAVEANSSSLIPFLAVFGCRSAVEANKAPFQPYFLEVVGTQKLKQTAHP